MMEIIPGLPDNVVGILARGRVTNEECDSVLRPAMERSLRKHGRIRLYYEVGSRFPGAGWDDLDVAIDHLPQWERIAVVTDTGWVRQTVNALRFLLASEVRVFTSGEIAEGRAWIAAAAEDMPGAPSISQLRALRRPPRARRPSPRPSARGDRRYRRPSAGGRQSR
jgi:SpoIIAA-like